MKNILEILQDHGIELKEDQKKAIERSVLENYKTVNDYENQTSKLEQAEKKANDLKSAFDDFKKGFDGVNVEEMKTRIETLESTLSEKQAEYEKEKNISSLLNTAKEKANEYGCVDFDLIEPLLNKDELLKSKDQTADITNFFEGLKEKKPILFKEKEPESTGETINIIPATTGKLSSDDSLMRMAMDLPPLKGEN